MGAQDKYLSAKVPNSIKRRIPKLRFFWGVLQFAAGKSSLHKMGWFASAWKEASVDGNKQPVPWITYPAIYFLEQRISKKMKVFEYGSGNSTLWWAKKAKSVIAVEHDEFWQKKLQSSAPDNATIIYRELGKKYSDAVLSQPGKFDVVVVDGRQRVECAIAAVSKLTKNGVIVWDNTDRERYKKGISHLEREGFRHIDFYGPMPIDNIVSLTSVFYRDNNILGL